MGKMQRDAVRAVEAIREMYEESGIPCSVFEVSDCIGLSPGMCYHLLRMALRDGRLMRLRAEKTGNGNPAYLYCPAEERRERGAALVEGR